jgi:hypothetical protein
MSLGLMGTARLRVAQVRRAEKFGVIGFMNTSLFVDTNPGKISWNDGRHAEFGYMYSYDLSVPRRNALSPPKVWQVSKYQMHELRLWDDSSVDCFACAVFAGAYTAGLRGES